MRSQLQTSTTEHAQRPIPPKDNQPLGRLSVLPEHILRDHILSRAAEEPNFLYRFARTTPAGARCAKAFAEDVLVSRLGHLSREANQSTLLGGVAGALPQPRYSKLQEDHARDFLETLAEGGISRRFERCMREFDYQAGDEGSLRYLREATLLQPDSTDAQFALGSELFYTGNYLESAASLQRTVELEPDFSEAHRLLGEALKFESFYLEAVKSLRRANELDPEVLGARLSLPYCLAMSGEHEEARAAYISYFASGGLLRAVDIDLAVIIGALISEGNEIEAKRYIELHPSLQQ